MNLVYWLVFGAVTGGIAKAIYPGKSPTGWLPTIALGVIGSVLGGLPFGDQSSGVAFSIAGSVAALFLYRWYEDSRHAQD